MVLFSRSLSVLLNKGYLLRNKRPDILPFRLPGLVSLFFFLLFFLHPVSAAFSNDVPTRDDIQNQLKVLTERKEHTFEEKASIADLEKALSFLDKIEKIQQDSEQLEKKLQQLPQKLQQITAELANLKSHSQQNENEYKQNLATMSLKQLESKQSSTLNRLQKEQDNLANYNSELIGLQTQPERAQNLLFNNVQRLQQLRNLLNNAITEQSDVRHTEIELLQTEQAFLNQQKEYQKSALRSNTKLQTLLQLQRDYTSFQIEQLERHVQFIQDMVNGKHLIDSEETAKEAQNSDDTSPHIQSNPLVREEIMVNREFSERLVAATRDNNQLVQKKIQVKNFLDRAIQSERDLKEQIKVLRGSLLLSRILFQEQLQVPQAVLTKDLPTKIADLRLEQFEIAQQRDRLYLVDDYINQLLNQHASDVKNESQEVVGEIRNTIEQLLEIRRELLNQLNNQLGQQITQAINLQMDQQELLDVTKSLEQTLVQQIFWVNSNKPMNWVWLKSLPILIHEELTHFNVHFSVRGIISGLQNSIHFVIPFLLVGLFLRWQTKSINAHLKKISAEIGLLRRDSQLHTPLALILTLIKTLPLAFIILAIGYWYSKSDDELGGMIWDFSGQLALFWVVYGFCYQILDKGGIGEQHFSLDREACSLFRKNLMRLSVALLPILFWITLGVKHPLRLSDDVIGQCTVLVCLFFVFIFIFPFCRQVWHEKSSHMIRTIVVTMLTFAPLILIVLMVSGYFYTALRLSERWLYSVYLLLLWHICYQSCLRGLSLAARRIAYRRAISRRQAQAKEGAEGEVVEEPPMALELINQQSLRLTTMVLFLIFFMAFYWIWSDLVTVFSYLDGINLWQYSTTTDQGNILQHVTLKDLALSVAMLVISWVMMRNLPGLLEVLVLSRLQLQQGSSYAIKTTLTYLIIGVGGISALATLGVSWNKLQWLAAALSVGLGFGLQEIFANFVSGLIILFERPVRIGDTVTIGTYSGSVSKIRIRATTITDFDRKEVIIPNRAFVTERLINWTLSDTITRIIIKVGVAYGSDLDKVKDVMLQAAKSNHRVMSEPEPQVYFMNFGASTLDHELRLYVRELGDRSRTVDEVNRSIDKLCRENGINIAFNQLEVYLHNGQGNSLQEVQRSISGAQRHTGEPPKPDDKPFLP
ncbi:mechanosensitive channel MscK [Xenorhabdus innexi]|uniref:Miniconductance mechanosensitive channel MscM n=1 Tax=Xenorhabdus innexi TaxID=290109 RepID=A0A1N6MTR0_9GAMM|nr:mechanosensitive channel MscK [Xenorhabdus innexi]PHM36839.1 miniconductance mechanosensitive channel MscM [Xenorhabdus innexi]SIP72201.1 Potassium efflux system KefA [Xenorhabdus innexi]